MPSPGPRSAAERRADALAHLSAEHADVWVATAAPDGRAHLVPLSLAWDGTRVLLAVEGTSLTARNLAATPRARLSLGTTRDVVMVDATLDETVGLGAADDALAEAYATQTDWDPRHSGPGYVYLALRPERVQVWREQDEIEGRTVMRDGRWIT
jgi:general stress protein 26